MHITIYPDADALSNAAAQFVVNLAHEAIITRGRFTLALAGGSTPRKLYALLGEEPYRSQIDWTLTDLFWSDERCVPPSNEDSNYAMAHTVLLSKLPIAANRVHRIPAEQSDREAAAQAYTLEMQANMHTEGIPVFDLIQLGMGPEGHTASLFPHQPSLQEHRRLVMPVSVPKPPPDRLTFTLPILNAARNVLFLVAGSDKAEILQAVLEGEPQPAEYPAQNVRPTNGELIWMLDTAAAAKLQERKQ